MSMTKRRRSEAQSSHLAGAYASVVDHEHCFTAGQELLQFSELLLLLLLG